MKAYLLQTGRSVSPFDEPVGELRVHNRPLREHQTDLLSRQGLEVEPIDDLRQATDRPCVLLHDDLYLTHHALAGFLRLARKRQRRKPGNLGAALAVSPLTEHFSPNFQGRIVSGSDGENLRAYDLYLLTDWDANAPLDEQVTWTPIPHPLTVRRTRVNRYFDPSGSFSLPMSTVALCPLRHWSSLLAAHLLGMPSCMMRAAHATGLGLATLPGRIAWRAGSAWPSRLRGKLYLAGRGCKVHPTAHVEWAVLGRGVRIGPNAVVRGAVLDDRVEIGPGAIVEMSTLGEKATINGNVTLRSCVVGEEANVGAYFTQLSVIGRGAALCPGSALFDFNLRGNVSVSFQGRTVSSGSRMLGGCIGHGAFLGAEVQMASGHELPAGCILVRSPRDVVGDVRQSLPADVVRVDRGPRRRREQLAAASDERLSQSG
jgi:carbonic anhydrase/acetyltransferase-like protein (isoleucine patch superfamily)